MQFDEIREALRTGENKDIEDLRATFQQTGNDPGDLDGFVSWLHQRGVIGKETLSDLHTSGALVLNDFKTLAATYFPEELDDDDNTEEDDPSEEWPADGQTAAFPIKTKQKKRPRDDKYVVLSKLAEGAMGEIHIARDLDLMRKVAIKKMTKRVANNRKLSSRFYQEAQITAQLDHPNIVPVYALEPSSDGSLTYVMKLIRGRTFSTLIDDSRALHDARKPLDELHDQNARLEYFLKVCDAIAYAHSRGVIHRDLKPDNIMVGAFGEVFVMDWGIARLTGTTNAAQDEELLEVGDTLDGVGRTRIGAVIGTPAYMSPEQAEGNNDLIDGRSDQFSLGLILFELLYLKQAIGGRDGMSILVKVQRAELEPAVHHDKRVMVPSELLAIVRKATKRDRERRYANVKALADDVRRFMRGEATEASPESLLRKFYRWIGAHRELAMGFVFMLVFMVGATGIAGLLLNVVALQMADSRKGRLANHLRVVAGQAHDLDSTLLEYQGLLKILAASAVDAAELPDAALGPRNSSYYLAEGFSPPDYRDSERYQRAVSIDWPVMANTTEEEEALRSIKRLTEVGPTMRRLLLQSHSESALGRSEDEINELIRTSGTPIAWTYVALEDGAFANYPGHGGFPPGFEPRKENWYELVSDGEFGPHWGNPHIDVAGLGLTLPCSMALYDDDGLFLGVAGIELTFDYIIDELLEVPGLEDQVDSYVIDVEGNIVVGSDDKRRPMKGTTKARKKVRLKKYRHKEVVKRMIEEPSGWMEVDNPDGGTDLVIYYYLKSIGYTYIVQGDAGELL